MILGKEVGIPVGAEVGVWPDGTAVDDWAIIVGGNHMLVAVSVPVGVIVRGA